MKLIALMENQEIDSRVSITPDIAKKLIDLGHEVLVEKDAGQGAGFSDLEYEKYGVKIAERTNISEADVAFSINPLAIKDIKKLKKNAIVISNQEPFQRNENISLFKEREITSFALEFIPRTTRAQYMDVLSSQASLAGYKAAIEAAHILNRGLPLMITTAGTVPAAKVLVMGAGVAGLQAIATAKRLGAIVGASDVRASVKEQVESLGAKFIEVESSEKTDGVYAKEMSDEYKKAQEAKLRSVLPNQDIVITTAQIPGKRAPIIIKSDMVALMKSGSIIIDLASKTGGNCENTEPGKTVEVNGVKIVAFDNILNLIAYDASRLFAKNIFSFFELLTQQMEKQKNISNIDDEIIKATLLTCEGKIISGRINLN
ncbi:MAG: NAD(P) transhydrogenase subunit alpha [Holosporales bacterium]|jgi:NAD(P) transhydrogenase subunit alpha|nr:NAD(P) transhydrogenase subunit alpha [Holosporales bacterium]